MFSNRYIFLYTVLVVVIVAAVLSLAATFLQAYQYKNVQIEKMQSILSSADIFAEKEIAQAEYEKFIVKEILVNDKGQVKALYADGKLLQGNLRPFQLELKEQLAVRQAAMDGKSENEALFPIYVCLKNTDSLYIIPVQGKGLWGAIWGYIAIKNDFNTVVGVSFDHKGETPGLGAEIADAKFQLQFVGKKIFDEQGAFTSIKVLKTGQRTEQGKEHEVDAISGGTITSNGVSDMLSDCLQLYLPFFEKMKLSEVSPLPVIDTTFAQETYTKDTNENK